MISAEEYWTQVLGMAEPKYCGNYSWERFKEGWDARGEQFIAYLKEYRRAYDESLFPPVDMEQYCPECRTATAGRMGRFLLDNCMRELAQQDNARKGEK